MSWHQGFVIVWKPPERQASVVSDTLSHSESMAWCKVFGGHSRQCATLDEMRAEGAKDYYFAKKATLHVEDEE